MSNVAVLRMVVAVVSVAVVFVRSDSVGGVVGTVIVVTVIVVAGGGRGGSEIV